MTPNPQQPAGPHNASGGDERVPSRIATALMQLAEAQRYAVGGRSVWDFAVEIGSLGLRANDLRWLIYGGFVEHGWETTRAGDENRSFRPNMGITLSQRSCFVATAAGLSLSMACSAVAKVPVVAVNTAHPNLPSGPHWDPKCRELHMDGVLVKQFRRPAPNQERILSAFQEEGWPSSVDDPLPGVDQDPTYRLQYTIHKLNRHQKNKLIRFEGNGAGNRVVWKRIQAASNGRSVRHR